MLNQLSRFFLRSAGSGPDSARSRDTANVEIVLPWLLAREGEETQFPVAYLEFLRTCLERKRFPIIPVKKYRGGHDQDSARRFASLLGALSNLPAIEIAVAIRLARVSDSLHSNAANFQNSSWFGDIRAHFEMSSSFGHKGRVLTTIVRFMRCSRCLELGTAYGMSGLFILEALSARGAETQLITVEGSERLHRMASALLESCFPGRVSCEYGWTSHVLPRLAGNVTPVDFMFHDAGHSRKDYVNDFLAALPSLAAGAVVLFDDINWNDPRFASINPQCRKGWLEVVGHERVVQAVEIGEEMGLVLLK
jgi:predicted O-methyltransferase YrrM